MKKTRFNVEFNAPISFWREEDGLYVAYVDVNGNKRIIGAAKETRHEAVEALKAKFVEWANERLFW